MNADGQGEGAAPVSAPDASNSTAATPWSKALAWLPALAYTGLIWWLSSQAVSVEGIEHFPFQDKGVHFVEYGGLGLMLCFAVHRTWPGRGARTSLVAAFLTSALGLLDEFHQAFVPERSADVFDLVADTCGALAAVVVYELLRYGLRRRRATRSTKEVAPQDGSSSAT